MDAIDMQALGKRLITARQARQMTQEKLAEAADLHRPTLAALERGRKPHIRGDTLYRLCKALGISADYLLGLKE